MSSMLQRQGSVQTFSRFAILFCYSFLGLSLISSIVTSWQDNGAPYTRNTSSKQQYGLQQKYTGELPPCTVPHDVIAELRLSEQFTYHCTPVQANPLRTQQTDNPQPVQDGQLLWSREKTYTLNTLTEANLNASPARKQDVISLTTTVEQDKPFGNEVVFGVASDAKRIRERAGAMAHWLADTGSLLLVSLPLGDKGEQANELQSHLSSLRINAKIVFSGEAPIGRYFHLIKDFAETTRSYHKWFVYIDDDTFFVSSGRLNRLLSRHNPKDLLYIGNTSEDWYQIGSMEEIFAFGGAGIITSRALQDQLAKVYDTCNADWPRPFGDYQLARCIYGQTTARLTLDYSMRQGDLKGDVGGLFESGRHFTSLHHWKSWWFNIDVTQLVKVATKTTAGGIAERFEVKSPNAAHRNAILTNGVSIVEYPATTFKSIDFTKLERTWDHRVPDRFFFDFSLGPLRGELKEGVDRFTHRMERSWIDEKHPARPVHQLYIQRATKPGNTDDIIHLLWI